MSINHTDTLSRIFAVLLLGALSACATAPPEAMVDFKQDYDFRAIRTLAFLPDAGSTSGDSPKAFLSSMQRERINTGLARALEEKGFTLVTDHKTADAQIAWHLVVQEKTDLRSYDSGLSHGVGYGYYNRRARYSCWNCGITDVRVTQYTKGTFIVDILDPASKKSVWRGIIESRLKGELGHDQYPYDRAAERVMADFPPL